jgi:hypothetical protein
MKLNENQSLEQILESAIVASWKDLTNGVHPGLLHIEYNFAPGGTLDDLRIWSSITRGHWLLVCEYWTSASNSHSSGVRFETGYHSEGLAHILEFVMQTPERFCASPKLRPTGITPDSAPLGRRNRSSRGLGARSLRRRQLSSRRACLGLTSGILYVEDHRSFVGRFWPV